MTVFFFSSFFPQLWQVALHKQTFLSSQEVGSVTTGQTQLPTALSMCLAPSSDCVKGWRVFQEGWSCVGVWEVIAQPNGSRWISVGVASVSLHCGSVKPARYLTTPHTPTPPSCVFMGLHASMQQLDSDNEQTAVILVNITASAPELEVTAITVTTSIVEDLTPAAIDQPEVCSFPLSPLFFSPLFPLSS